MKIIRIKIGLGGTPRDPLVLLCKNKSSLYKMDDPARFIANKIKSDSEFRIKEILLISPKELGFIDSDTYFKKALKFVDLRFWALQKNFKKLSAIDALCLRTQYFFGTEDPIIIVDSNDSYVGINGNERVLALNRDGKFHNVTSFRVQDTFLDPDKILFAYEI